MNEIIKCLECGKEFNNSKRNSPFWVRQYNEMGSLADICDVCWKKEYGIDVTKK